MEFTPNTFDTRKLLIALTVTLCLVILVYLVIASGKKKDTASRPTATPSPSGPTAVPALQITLAIPKNISEVPTIPYKQGGGIDVSSPLVKDSEENIKKLLAALPYQKEIKTSNGLTIEVLIPPADLQENKWTFSATVYGIDYQAPEGTPEYILNRTAFREGAADIFNFVRKQGVDPEKLIFQWGDREFIEERAKKWLQ